LNLVTFVEACTPELATFQTSRFSLLGLHPPALWMTTLVAAVIMVPEKVTQIAIQR
jgi:hypothetical protein